MPAFVVRRQRDCFDESLGSGCLGNAWVGCKGEVVIVARAWLLFHSGQDTHSGTRKHSLSHAAYTNTHAAMCALRAAFVFHYTKHNITISGPVQPSSLGEWA